jgi:hypothetical protein
VAKSGRFSAHRKPENYILELLIPNPQMSLFVAAALLVSGHEEASHFCILLPKI